MSLMAALVMAVTFVIQTTVVPRFQIGEARPDLILVVAVCFAFAEGPVVGAMSGFIGGMLQDLFAIRLMGLSALTKTVVGYLAGQVERSVFAEHIILPMGAVFLASLANDGLYLAGSFLLGEAMPVAPVFWGRILPSAVYNALVTFVIYRLLLKTVAKEPRTTDFEPAKVEKLEQRQAG